MLRSRFVRGWAAATGAALLSAGPLAAAPHPATAHPATAAGPGGQDAAATVGGERLGRPSVQVAPLAGAPALPPRLTGRSWLVADAATGEVLAAQNAHLPLPPASTLKMLFAETVLPRFDRSLEHRVSPAELAGLGAGSSLVGIKENMSYRVEDLWRGVFLSSGNDAVHVLAHMNGGLAATVAQMQARADALQARDTRVVTPDGYDQDGQVSSAYDLTLFARAGLRNRDFRTYCGTRSAQFPGGLDKATGRRTAFEIANTDRLLGRYPGLIGVKNGYTTKAGATFTGAAERDGRTLLVTVMHPETHQLVYDEAASLLDWGFAAAGKVEPVGLLAAETGGADGSSAAPSADPVLPRAVEDAGRALGPVGGLAAGAAALALGAGGWFVLTRRRRLATAAAGAASPGTGAGAAKAGVGTAGTGAGVAGAGVGAAFQGGGAGLTGAGAAKAGARPVPVPAGPVRGGATAIGGRAGATALGGRRGARRAGRRLHRAVRTALAALRTGPHRRRR